MKQNHCLSFWVFKEESLQESPNCVVCKFKAIPVSGDSIYEFQPVVDA